MSQDEDVGSPPRKLRPKERDVLEGILPADRPGYLAYRQRIQAMEVIGEGRRGEGNFVLGMPGDTPDTTSPLGPVFAYGMVETTRDAFSVTVREQVGNQIDVEIVSSHGEALPDHYEEKRRWTYSTWSPGKPSPQTGALPREVSVSDNLILAVLDRDRRLLLHDRDSGVNHLIPITTFYGELMLVKNIRDPAIALHPHLLFQEMASHSDDELRRALIAYDRIKRRFQILESPPVTKPRRGISSLLKKVFGER